LGILACADRDSSYCARAFWSRDRGATARLCQDEPGAIPTTILPRPKWDELLAALSKAINSASIPDDAKETLTGKIRSGTNSTPPRERLRAISQALNITIGDDEDAAWKRRDQAAHGLPIPEGKELEAIRDMKLLTGLFHRLLLSITGAADSYIDYASTGLPPRSLKDPVPLPQQHQLN
jgi:hypothetical protein